jgi:hypothetical protein
VDLDGDGNVDILSGSYSRMESKMAGLFQVLYGNGDGTFRKAEALKGNDGEPLIIPVNGEDNIIDAICTRPFAVDWNGDGLLDLVVGNFTGTFFWFRGEGKGRFEPKPELIKAGDAPLRLKDGHHSDPCIIDWDGDGDLDIVSGSSSGGVQWAENIAGKGKLPAFKGFRDLIKPAPRSTELTILREQDLTGPMQMTRVWVDDVNGDGKLDILVGDMVTLISPADGVSEEEMKSKLKAWQKEFDAAVQVLSKEQEKLQNKQKDKKDPPSEEELKALQKVQAEYRKLYEQRSKFMKEEMTGYVWLYLRR